MRKKRGGRRDPVTVCVLKGLSQKSRLVSGTDPNLDLSREFDPFPGKSGASQIFLQGLVAEILYFLSAARKVAEIKRKYDLRF